MLMNTKDSRAFPFTKIQLKLEFMENVEYMDTSDFPWCWYYLADCGRWHLFEDDPDNPFHSDKMEQLYQTNPKGVCNIATLNCRNQVDFSAMIQTDLNTGKQRRIKRDFNIERSCSCFSAAPVFWDNVDPSLSHQLIPLSKLSPEYKTVAEYVKNDGLLDKSISFIYRIQNLDLWELYCRKKKQLMRIHNVKEIQERRLFHGTDSNNVDSICKYNFDLRLAGQHGSAYGKGIYFAIHASYADQYSSNSINLQPRTHGFHSGNMKTMFLARVMVGKSTAGKSDFLKPDHGSLDNTHDSCVNYINHPTIFIIFDQNQIYPEYLIQYWE